jgi:hypothetical protein
MSAIADNLPLICAAKYYPWRGKLENFLENCAGFEVLTAAAMKSAIFWDITPSSPLKVN